MYQLIKVLSLSSYALHYIITYFIDSFLLYLIAFNSTFYPQ